MKARFRGTDYEVRFGPIRSNPDAVGLCDWTKCRITILPSLKGVERLDTEIHEAIHACLPDVAEEAVGMAAEDIARYLWRRGYRLIQE
jgi:hypothetical protein